jgi:hypothetical protein
MIRSCRVIVPDPRRSVSGGHVTVMRLTANQRTWLHVSQLMISFRTAMAPPAADPHVSRRRGSAESATHRSVTGKRRWACALSRRDPRPRSGCSNPVHARGLPTPRVRVVSSRFRLPVPPQPRAPALRPSEHHATGRVHPAPAGPWAPGSLSLRAAFPRRAIPSRSDGRSAVASRRFAPEVGLMSRDSRARADRAVPLVCKDIAGERLLGRSVGARLRRLGADLFHHGCSSIAYRY